MSKFSEAMKQAAENAMVALSAIWRAVPQRGKDFARGLVFGVALTALAVYFW